MTQAVINLFILFSSLLLCYVFIIIWLYLHHKRNRTVQINDASYLIVYASQSGQSETFAQHTAKQLQAFGESVILLNIDQLSTEHLTQAHKVLWMVSTYGDGDAPDTAQNLNWLFHQNLDLSHQSFAVLAFGDRHYQQFCAFGKQLNQTLIQQGALAWFDYITVDQMSKNDLSKWNDALAEVTQHHVSLMQIKKQWHQIRLSQRQLLNEGSQGTGLYQLDFEIPPHLTWQSGDILEIRCHNTAHDLEKFFELYPDCRALKLETLKFKNLRKIPIKQKDQSIEKWISQFIDLPLREYSIASIPEQQCLSLIIRQEISEDGLGIGSGLLTQHLNINEALDISIRNNPAFHLLNQATPAIFIGNGSGIAGLLSHLHQREKNQQHQNWLIFGERQKRYDAIFKEQTDVWQKNGLLSDVDRAYSRDADSAYKYVQDVLIHRADDIKKWLEQGAVIYVCGSLKGMGKGVDLMLLNILGAEQLQKLKADKRYLRDVY